MERPKLPTSSELKRANEAVPGSAEQLLNLHCEAIRNFERRTDEEHVEQLKHLAHLRFYRYLSVASGTFLAFAALVLCGFAIERQTDITPLSYVLGPVTILAGAFLWGYRPRKIETKLPEHQPKIEEANKAWVDNPLPRPESEVEP